MLMLAGRASARPAQKAAATAAGLRARNFPCRQNSRHRRHAALARVRAGNAPGYGIELAEQAVFLCAEKTPSKGRAPDRIALRHAFKDRAQCQGEKSAQ